MTNEVSMKNLKKLNRDNLKKLSGGNVCNHNCPPGPYGPDPQSCAAFDALPACCKARVIELPDCL